MTWDLRLGSCLDQLTGLVSLADTSVDVTIMDPPYEAEAHTLMRRSKPVGKGLGASESREVVEAPLDFAPITSAERRDVATQIARVTRHCALVFCQAEAIDAWRIAFNATELTYRRAIPWLKPDAMPSLHGRWPGQSFEALVLAMRSKARSVPRGGGALSYTHNKNGHGPHPHPTTKPLPLMRAIVADFTLPGDLILDAFAGSGTTGVACRELGRDFIGWELSPEYHAIATRRLNGDEAKPRKEQPGLFDALKETA